MPEGEVGRGFKLGLGIAIGVLVVLLGLPLLGFVACRFCRGWSEASRQEQLDNLEPGPPPSWVTPPEQGESRE